MGFLPVRGPCQGLDQSVQWVVGYDEDFVCRFFAFREFDSWSDFEGTSGVKMVDLVKLGSP